MGGARRDEGPRNNEGPGATASSAGDGKEQKPPSPSPSPSPSPMTSGLSRGDGGWEGRDISCDATVNKGFEATEGGRRTSCEKPNSFGPAKAKRLGILDENPVIFIAVLRYRVEMRFPSKH